MLQYIKMVFTKSKSKESSFQICRLFDNLIKSWKLKYLAISKIKHILLS